MWNELSSDYLARPIIFTGLDLLWCFVQVTELHRNLTLWLVNLLRHMTADHLSWECHQWQESDREMDEKLRLLRAHKLQHEAEELVVEMGRLSGSIVRYQQRFSISSKGVFSRKNMQHAERLIMVTDPVNLFVLRTFPRSWLDLTGICREPNEIGTPKENSSDSFIPSTTMKHASICHCMGSAHTSEDDFQRM